NLQKFQSDLATVEQKKKFVAGALDSLAKEAKALNDVARSGPMAQVEALRDEIRTKQNVMELLAAKMEQLELAPAAAPSVTVIQQAQRPEGMDRSRQMKVGLAAGVGMFGLLLFGVAFLEFRTRKITGSSEIVHGLGMSLVGTLPSLPLSARRQLAAKATP